MAAIEPVLFDVSKLLSMLNKSTVNSDAASRELLPPLELGEPAAIPKDLKRDDIYFRAPIVRTYEGFFGI